MANRISRVFRIREAIRVNRATCGLLCTFPFSFFWKSEIACAYKSTLLQRTLLKSFLHIPYLSRDMRFPTMWYVRPAKPQTSLRIRAVWSESLLVTCIFYERSATDWTSFGVSNLKGGCTGSSESTLVKITHCWKSYVAAHLYSELIIENDVWWELCTLNFFESYNFSLFISLKPIALACDNHIWLL